MKCKVASIFVAIMLMASVSFAETKVIHHLLDVSVTIQTDRGSGSGVLITRDVKLAKDDKKTVKVNFVWTAAHVVNGLRSTRIVIGPNGIPKTIVEFRDAEIVKELRDPDTKRKTGEVRLYGKVVLYSDSEDGEDLALLLVRDRQYTAFGAEFDLDNKPVDIGTDLIHVGSLLGQGGSNSVTKGIMSKTGRVLSLGSGDGVVFDQTTCSAFPGSSGGGVFLTDGKYIGMLVRGAGETFNFTVPVRRMARWCKDRNVMWALDAKANIPSLREIKNIKPEDNSVESASEKSDDSKNYPTIMSLNKDKVEKVEK